MLGQTQFCPIDGHPHKCLNNLTPYITAAVAASVAFYLWRRKRSQDARDMFGLFIRSQISALPARDVGDFYRRTKPDIKDAVHRIWHFLAASQRDRLDRLWSEYDELPPQDLDPKGEGAWGESCRRLRSHFGEEGPTDPHALVRYYFDEFYKFAT